MTESDSTVVVPFQLGDAVRVNMRLRDQRAREDVT
jgi:hypothetical protein